MTLPKRYAAAPPAALRHHERWRSLRLHITVVKINFPFGKVNLIKEALNAAELEEALSAVGGLLQAEDAQAAIVVVGGASLTLLGLVPRTTRDVESTSRECERRS